MAAIPRKFLKPQMLFKAIVKQFIMEKKFAGDVLTTRSFARQHRPTSANWLSLGTDYCITFTPPFVSKDFNKLETPSFEGAPHIENCSTFALFTLKSLF